MSREFLLARLSSTPVVISIRFSKQWLRVFVAIWLTVTCNSVFFSQIDAFALIPSAILLLLLNYLLVLLVSPSRFFKPMLVALIVTGAATNYFSVHFGTMIDSNMVQNMVETNPEEVRDLITWAFVRHMIVYALLPCLLIVLHKSSDAQLLKRATRLSVTIFATLVVILAFAMSQYQSLSGYFRVHKELRYYATPINALSALKGYVKGQLPKGSTEFVTIADRVAFSPFSTKPTVFIVVLGETVRADHLSLNHYARNTNPQLSKLPLINFSHMTSCGTATAHSVPCMFSWMGHDNYDEFTAKHSENVIDIIARAGFDVQWRENDGGCKDVCNRVNTLDVSKNEQCQDGCPDRTLFRSLPAFENVTQNQVIVLHQQGSHGPAYFRRSEKAHKVFVPECQDETFADCTAQEIVNAYDNSLVETDALLADLIANLSKLKNVNAGLLYVSDHGESLGENGVYLHGLPYAFAPKSQIEVPMLMWLSQSYQKDATFDFSCLTQVASQPTSHDALFGSLLGVLSITIQSEKPLTDLVSQCRREHAA